MTSHPIAVLGENLVDLLVSSDGSVNAVIGGGPLNVARSIGRLGGDARFVSGVSSDAFGSFVRAALADSNVELALDTARGEPTTLAVVELNDLGPRYHFHLNETAAFALDERETTGAVHAMSHLAAMYFGTLGLLVEPMASLGEALIMNCASETLAVIDPNCRPSAVRDHDAYRSRVARLSARADVVKVSTEDLDYLYPGRTALEGGREILQLGATCVLITDGAAPVTAMTNEFEVSVAVAPTTIVDTVGAGDALVGGFMTWWTGHDLSSERLHEASLLEEAVSAAIEISRLTCQRAGAQPPRRDEVADLDGWRWL
ncbi:MAG: carbohydrate kinase [Acidimicrobiaceae bacterium]|nr:carbohydrate kinase [Acidimicrobiaceae bacterium]